MKTLLLAAAAAAMIASIAFADESKTFNLSIKDHKFVPATLEIPANEKIKLVVKNEDATPAEFESSDLDREKVVGANSEITVFIGPLTAGNYGFFDDFHRSTTTGTLTAK
jgi:plastocyanin